MTAYDFQLGKFSNTARLFKLVSRMSEDKQFILFEEGIHSLSNIRYKSGPLVADWLAEKLGGTIV